MEFCTLASGSSGNCAVISRGGTRLLLDAGISMKKIRTSLMEAGIGPGGLTAVLLTHEHSDHIKALPMLAKTCSAPIFTTHGTAQALYAVYPELCGSLTEFSAGETLEFDGISVQSIPTPHDTPESVGYRFNSEEGSLVFVTDMGCVAESVYRASLGADAAVIEANHDVTMLRYGKYPPFLKRRILSDRGHLSNEDCGKFAAALALSGTKRIVLAHLSRENNTPGTALEAVSAALTESGARDTAALSVAPAFEPGELFVI